MNKLTIRHFKAFRSEITIPIDKNLLIYGENGAGKSSIYDAFTWIFYSRKLLERKLHSGVTPENTRQIDNDLHVQYRNLAGNTPFEIEIDGVSYTDYDKSNYRVSMLSFPDLYSVDEIRFDKLLSSSFIPSNVVSKALAQYDTITGLVNHELKELFTEDIQIRIEPETFIVTISDAVRQINRNSELTKYYNEGKLHLVNLLLLLYSILLEIDYDKHNTLILDDFVTSLDNANRHTIVKFILDNFSDYQKIIFTHSCGFYNMFQFEANLRVEESDLWNNINLISVGDNIDINYPRISIDDIKKHLTDPNIGNQIRQKFEEQLHELSKIFMYGPLDEVKLLITRIEEGKKLYFSKDMDNNVHKLLDRLEILANKPTKDASMQEIRNQLASYRHVQLDALKETVRELHAYQKIMMHPQSHGNPGLRHMETKEAARSVEFLEKLDKIIKSLGSNKAMEEI